MARVRPTWPVPRMPGANIVALCDVDTVRGAKSIKTFSKAKIYSDFPGNVGQAKGRRCRNHKRARSYPCRCRHRRHGLGQAYLLSKAFDPFHSRSPCSDGGGGQEQAGHANGQSGPFRRAYPSSGRIGSGRYRRATFPEVHVWTNRPDLAPRVDRASPEGEDAGRSGLGPLVGAGSQGSLQFEIRSFQVARLVGLRNRCALGDMACHIMDMPYWALGFEIPACQWKPSRVAIPRFRGPNWSVIKYQFPARGVKPSRNDDLV